MSSGRRKMKYYVKRYWFYIVSLLLVILAIWQVFLVFGNPMQRFRMQEAEQETLPGEAVFLTPVELYATLGGKENGAYTRLSAEDPLFWDLSEDLQVLLGELLKNGEIRKVSSSELPSDLLMGVFEFSYAADAKALESIFHAEDLPMELSFTDIFVVPSVHQEEQAQVFFWNPYTEEAWWVGGLEREREENLTLYKDLLEAGSRLLEGTDRYVDAGSAFAGRFPRGIFSGDLSKKTESIRGSLSSGFRMNGVLRTAIMNNYAYQFFEYPDAVNRMETENYLVFSNEKITLKLAEDGYVQYVHTPTDAEKQEVYLEEAYEIASDFLKQDLSYMGESTLGTVFSGYEIRGSEYVFYFDYTVGGFPVDLAVYPSLMEEARHPVEIHVLGKIVRESRRWILRIDLQQESRALNLTWIEAADMALSSSEEGAELMEVPELVYYYSGHALLIAWRVTLKNGSVLYVSD